MTGADDGGFFLESIFVRLGVQNPTWHFEYVQDNRGSNVR